MQIIVNGTPEPQELSSIIDNALIKEEGTGKAIMCKIENIQVGEPRDNGHVCISVFCDLTTFTLNEDGDIMDKEIPCLSK